MVIDYGSDTFEVLWMLLLHRAFAAWYNRKTTGLTDSEAPVSIAAQRRAARPHQPLKVRHLYACHHKEPREGGRENICSATSALEALRRPPAPGARPVYVGPGFLSVNPMRYHRAAPPVVWQMENGMADSWTTTTPFMIMNRSFSLFIAPRSSL